MKKILVTMLVLNLVLCITGCSNKCKIDNCNEKTYKEGLCEQHYSLIHKEDKEISEEDEITENEEQQSAVQSIKVPFSGEGRNESSDGITPSDYILPESDMRNYTLEELNSLSEEELRLARNEIFARRGRKFNSEDMNAYFSGKLWYKPLYDGAEFDAKGDSILNEYEVANKNLILSIESQSNENKAKEDGLDAPSKHYLDIYGYTWDPDYNSEYSNLSFAIYKNTIVDQGNYYEVGADYYDVLTVRGDLKMGDSLSVITDYVTGERATLVYDNSDNSYCDFNISVYNESGLLIDGYYYRPTGNANPVRLLQESDIPFYVRIYNGKLYARKDAVIESPGIMFKNFPEANQLDKFYSRFANEDQTIWIDRLYFDNKGYASYFWISPAG